MEVAGADSWLPLKEMSPLPDGEDRDCSSPITIVAQDYLDDPPVRDIPATPSSRPSPQRPELTAPLPPPLTHALDVTHAIAATASAVATSIPLMQLQRSIDTFCSTLIARSESRSQEPDRYALRMIEDLDFIKHHLSRPPVPSPAPVPASAPEPQRHLLAEFQSEVRQLKLRLEEQSSLARIYRPLTDIQEEISSLKDALTSKNIPTPPPVHHTPTSIPLNKLVSKECQTQVCKSETQSVTPSVGLQTSPPFRTPRPRKPLPSPILSSSPLSCPPAPLYPPLRISHLERKLREIQMSKKQLEQKSPHAIHPLPLSDIVQQVLNREGDDTASHAQQLVSEKMQSFRPADSTTAEKPATRDRKGRSSRQQREESSGYRHEQDPVYISRVYGHKQALTEKKGKATKTAKATVTPKPKPKPKPPEVEIGHVYKQIEKIQYHIEQLTKSRKQHILPPATRPPPPTNQYLPSTTKKQTARLLRPPRLMPSPYTPPEETKPPPDTSTHYVTCENAQVQTSFLPADTSVVSSSPLKHRSPPHREVRSSHTQTEAATVEVEGRDSISFTSHSPTHSHSLSTEREESSELLEQIISLQTEAGAGDRPLAPSSRPLHPQDPEEVAREQELGRRHLLERVQQMLLDKAAESVPDQARLSEARRKGESERKVCEAVESAIKREMLSCIRTARQELRERQERREEALQAEQEEVYSMSFASESDESLHPLPLPCPETFRPDMESTPYSPTFSLPPPLPMSATPEFPPSPRTRNFLQRSPPKYQSPSPESPGVATCSPFPVHIGVQCDGETLLAPQSDLDTSSPISEEIQCDMNNTLTNLRPSPPPISLVPTDVPSHLNPSSIPTPTQQVHADIQCDLRHGTPLPASTPLDPVHIGVQCDLKEVFRLPREAEISLPSYTTDYTPSADSTRLTDTDYPSYVSEGEYIPPGAWRRHRHRPSSAISVGEVPPLRGHQLSPSVEAALILKSFAPDSSDSRSPGEYRPAQPYKTPTRQFHQSEGIFSSGASSSPLTPGLPAPEASPGEATAADLTHSDSEHLSQSVTLSIAFSSPSNKTTTRHRDGVGVFDVSALEELSVPVGWDLTQLSREDIHRADDVPQPLSEFHTPPPSPQPDHVDLQLDGSSNSTSCDIHSLASLSKEAP